MKVIQERYIYNLIAYHDSWISLDPIIGCPYNCQYCVLRLPGWTQRVPEKLFSPEEAINRLVNHRYFIRNKTVVSLGNRTDSFLKENIEFTLETLLLIDKHGLRNPICIATKSRIPQSFIKKIKKLKSLTIIFFLSYSGLDKTLEPGIDTSSIRESFKLLADNEIPAVHFWRPLILSNTDNLQIQEMLAFVSKYAKASVIVGLKYSPKLRKILDNNPKLRIQDNNLPSYGDWLPTEIEKRVLKIARSQFQDYPIFKHTSCAVSYVLLKSDYNATIYRDDICKVSTCPNFQRKICENAISIPSIQQVSSMLDYLNLDLPFEIKKGKIIIHGELSQEDYIFLLHNLKFPIQAKIKYINVWHGSIFKEINNLRSYFNANMLAAPNKQISRPLKAATDLHR